MHRVVALNTKSWRFVTNKMPTLLETLIHSALAAVNGRFCVSEALKQSPINEPVYVLAVGKASTDMMQGLIEVAGHHLVSGVLIYKDGHLNDEQRALFQSYSIELIESSHPVLDERSLLAGNKALTWAKSIPENARVMTLISGGASALIEALNGLDLAQLQLLNQKWLSEGLDIAQINAQRRRYSKIKGGGLAKALKHARVEAWYISDVPNNDPRVIGSGLMDEPSVRYKILADANRAKQAVADQAREMGLSVTEHPQPLFEEIESVAEQIQHSWSQADVNIWSGEPTVTLPDNAGFGGRNQHLAMLMQAELKQGQVFASIGTDGTDGPTEFAGGWVSSEMSQQGRESALVSASSTEYLQARKALINTGPTGTNVMDIMIGINKG